MPNIEIPADRDPMIFLWSERANALDRRRGQVQ